MLRVLASCGAYQGTLREEACLARGDNRCEYVVTWAREPSPALAAGVGIVAALAATPLSGAVTGIWLLVPAAIAATYGFERWRFGWAAPLARTQAAASFHWLVAKAFPALPEEAPEPGASLPEFTAPEDVGVRIEREGDVWLVAYEGTTVRLRRSRGLVLLAHLIHNPRQDIHVSDLDAITPSGGSKSALAPEASVAPVRGDAGEILDAQARGEYRRRVADLREELETAEAHNDLGRVQSLRAELELLEEELRAAIGTGGRPRRASSDVERLRVAITHRIRGAIDLIAKHHPSLGVHLAATVSTGYRCVYDPAAATVSGERAADQPGQKT